MPADGASCSLLQATVSQNDSEAIAGAQNEFTWLAGPPLLGQRASPRRSDTAAVTRSIYAAIRREGITERL